MVKLSGIIWIFLLIFFLFTAWNRGMSMLKNVLLNRLGFIFAIAVSCIDCWVFKIMTRYFLTLFLAKVGKGLSLKIFSLFYQVVLIAITIALLPEQRLTSC